MDNPAIAFDSDEEIYFSSYLDEMRAAGVIKQWGRGATISLAPNVQHKFARFGKTGKELEPQTKVVLLDQTYTPDFTIDWEPVSEDVWFYNLKSEISVRSAPFIACGLRSTVEVKGGFTQHDESRIYSILAKWVWASTGVFVQRVKVCTKKNGIFDQTFTPGKFLVTAKTGQPRKLHYTPRTLQEFLTMRTSRAR